LGIQLAHRAAADVVRLKVANMKDIGNRNRISVFGLTLVALLFSISKFSYAYPGGAICVYCGTNAQLMGVDPLFNASQIATRNLELSTHVLGYYGATPTEIGIVPGMGEVLIDPITTYDPYVWGNGQVNNYFGRHSGVDNLYYEDAFYNDPLMRRHYRVLGWAGY